MTKNEKIVLAALGVTGGYALLRYHRLATGDARLDRTGIRGRALEWGIRLGVPPEALMAIAHAEGQAWLDPEISDTSDPRGPSVGPLAVLRTTAIADGFVPADTDADGYGRFGAPSQEGLTFGWGARHFATVYAAAGGDLRAALTAYNGASSYGADAMAWLASKYPGKFSTT